jgi:ankyrin repeat protein
VVKMAQDPPNFVALLKAIEGDKEAEVRSMLSGPLLAELERVSENGFTPLYFACMKGCSLKLIQLLLSRGAKVDQKGQDRETPLYIAVYNGHGDIADALLGAGANVNELNGFDGDTALHCASRQGNIELLSILVSHHANINSRNVHMETPLFLASKNNKVEAVYFLLNRDASRTTQNEEGKDPLYIASERGNKEVVMLLKTDKKYLKDVKSQVDVELRLKRPSLLQTESITIKALQEKEVADAAKKKDAPSPQKPLAKPGGKVTPTKPTKSAPPKTQQSPAAIPKAKATIDPIVIPKEPPQRTHDPLTGMALPKCKTMEEAGPTPDSMKPPAFKPAASTKQKENIPSAGGTMMSVGTGTGLQCKQRPSLVDQIPGDSLVFATATVKK